MITIHIEISTIRTKIEDYYWIIFNNDQPSTLTKIKITETGGFTELAQGGIILVGCSSPTVRIVLQAKLPKSLE